MLRSGLIGMWGSSLIRMWRMFIDQFGIKMSWKEMEDRMVYLIVLCETV